VKREDCTAAQVSQDEQGLPIRGQAPPAGADLSAALGELPGQEAQVRAGQIDRGRVGKHDDAPGQASDLGPERAYQERHIFM